MCCESTCIYACSLQPSKVHILCSLNYLFLVSDKSEDRFHYTTLIPFGGRLIELDGFWDYPKDLGGYKYSCRRGFTAIDDRLSREQLRLQLQCTIS